MTNKDVRLQGTKSLTKQVVEGLSGALAAGQVRPGEMLPTERQLADQYKVSRITIRAALAELAEAGWLQVIPRVGYAVLRHGSTAVPPCPVGLVSPDLAHVGERGIRRVAALEARLAASSRALVLGSSSLDTESEDACIRRLESAGVGGLIVTPAIRGKRSAELASWIQRKRPVVLAGHPGWWRLPDDLAATCYQVDVDNRGGVRQAVDHLLDLGHRQLAIICFDPPEKSERLTAFLESLRAHGLEPKPEWIVTGVPGGRKGGHEAFRRLQAAGELPTAVFCITDDLALGLMDAARSVGMAVPEDLSVIGFGNDAMSGADSLRELTTLDWSHELLASEMVRLLEGQISGGDRAQPERVRIPVRLVIRSSCAKPHSVNASESRMSIPALEAVR